MLFFFVIMRYCTEVPLSCLKAFYLLLKLGCYFEILYNKKLNLEIEKKI
jgi:hypothetical protein